MDQRIKVLLLSDANSIHTFRWVQGLSKAGVEIGLWSLAPPSKQHYEDLLNVSISYGGIGQTRKSALSKISYLAAYWKLKRFIRDFKPHIVHAHYASSYGLLGILSKFKPLVISVWGTDVYEFPRKNIVAKGIFKNNLKKCDKVLSTSRRMAEETAKYTDKQITVTPFGVDMSLFSKCCQIKEYTQFEEKPFTVGTVKALEEIYGINYLIEGYAIFKRKFPQIFSKLLIVGKGSEEHRLKLLAEECGVIKDCIFTGAVPFNKVPDYHAALDIAVYPSLSESFGVSAIESAAMKKPVIASDVGGLPEVISDQVTGIIVPAKDSDKIAQAIEILYRDERLRIEMGEKGFERVISLYNWENNLQTMIGIYNDLIGKKDALV